MLQKSEILGDKIAEKLNTLAKKQPYVGEIRRLGSMVAAEIVTDRAEKLPDKDKTGKIVKYANNSGLLLLSAGLKGNVIRFLAPLVITEEELTKGLSILEDAFESAEE